jgi:hypothetical protein
VYTIGNVTTTTNIDTVLITTATNATVRMLAGAAFDGPSIFYFFFSNPVKIVVD